MPSIAPLSHSRLCAEQFQGKAATWIKKEEVVFLDSHIIFTLSQKTLKSVNLILRPDVYDLIQGYTSRFLPSLPIFKRHQQHLYNYKCIHLLSRMQHYLLHMQPIVSTKLQDPVCKANLILNKSWTNPYFSKRTFYICLKVQQYSLTFHKNLPQILIGSQLQGKLI